MEKEVIVVGAGLAGSEAAYQLAKRGIKVKLYEMKAKRKTPAHSKDYYSELVCSNSLGSDSLENASGLMKEELRLSNPNLSSWSRVYDKISFKLNDIRTNKHDKELDNYLCVANLEGKISEQDIHNLSEYIQTLK